jgi:hypothetical protein
MGNHFDTAKVNCAEAEQTAHEIIVEVRDEIQSVKELNDYFRVAMKPPESRDIVVAQPLTAGYELARPPTELIPNELIANG